MKSDELLFNKAKKLHIDGKIKDAQVIYLKLLKYHSNNSNLLFLLATTYVQLKHYSKGKELINKSLQINSNLPESYNGRGIIFAEEGDYLNAIKDYDKAISLKHDYFDANLNKAVALKDISKFNEAIKYFEICIKLRPNDFKIYINLGNLYRDLRKYNAAYRCYTQAIKLNQNFAEAYSNRGDLLESYLKQFEKAIEDYGKALRINKNLDYIKGKILYTKMILHDWEDYDQEIKFIKDDIKNKKKQSTHFHMRY